MNGRRPRPRPRRRSPGDRPGRAALGAALLGVATLAVALAAVGHDPRGDVAAATARAAGDPFGLAVSLPRPRLRDPKGAAGRSGPASRWPAGRFHRVAVRRGERITLHRRPGGAVVGRLGPKTGWGSPTVLSVLATRGRWLRVATAVEPGGRGLWLRADPRRLQFGATDVSVHVSLSERAVELRLGDRVLHRFAVTVGAPGTETPTGRFGVTDLIVGGLNPVYGCCAVALTARQLDQPSGWVGGDRIAIHGTTGPVGNAASNGCLRATDADVRGLIERLPLGAPVFIRG